MKMSRRRSALGSFLAVLASLLLVGVSGTAYAFEIPNAAFTGAGVGTNPGSALTQTWSRTGATTIAGATTIGNRGYVASDFSPTVPTTQTSSDILTSWASQDRVAPTDLPTLPKLDDPQGAVKDVTYGECETKEGHARSRARSRTAPTTRRTT